MRICWVGWRGPESDEMAQGIFAVDPDPTFVMVGHGASSDNSAFHMLAHRRLWPKSNGEALAMIQGSAADVVFYHDYVYSAGHREEIRPAYPDAGRLVHLPEWADLPAFKVLHDMESFTQERYYREIAPRFDAVYTHNRKMVDAPCHRKVVLGVPGVSSIFAEVEPPPWSARPIAAVFSGSTLDRGYRAQLAAALQAWARTREEIVEIRSAGLDAPVFGDLLRRSKTVICTYACASGELRPIHPKKKDLEAVLCGAAPLAEIEGAEMPAGPARWLFTGFEGGRGLAAMLDGLLGAPEEIEGRIREARRWILENRLHRHIYVQALRDLGLL